MCGIVGYLHKRGDPEAPVGEMLYRMLTTLSCRGPDSAGVAMFGHAEEGHWILRVKLGEHGDFREKGCAVTEELRKLVAVRAHSVDAEYLRAVVAPTQDFSGL